MLVLFSLGPQRAIFSKIVISSVISNFVKIPITQEQEIQTKKLVLFIKINH